MFVFQHDKDTVDEVFQCMFSFMSHRTRVIQSDALTALGFVCVRHHSYMLESKQLKLLYLDILEESSYLTEHKVQVLNNVELYLKEEEIRMIKQDKHCELLSTYDLSHHFFNGYFPVTLPFLIELVDQQHLFITSLNSMPSEEYKDAVLDIWLGFDA